MLLHRADAKGVPFESGAERRDGVTLMQENLQQW